MDKIATENLFLLEFLVDKIQLDPALTRDIGDAEGATCVSVQFLDNAPLDICEDDFKTKRNYKKDNENLKSGKSCLFSLSPSQADEAVSQFDVYVDIFQKMPPGELPDKVQIGGSLISIVNLFNELVSSLISPNANQAPTAKTLKDIFKVTNTTGQYIGDISMYIRMSCFGKLIVTQFQMNLDDKSVMFKDREGHSLYRYKKVGSHAKESTSLGQNGFDVARGGSLQNKVASGAYSCPNVPSPRPSFNGKPKISPCTECSLATVQQQSELQAGCFQEIGATMGGNCLTIRVHKDTSKIEQLSTASSCACKTSKLSGSINTTSGSPTSTNIVMRPGCNESNVTNAPFSFKMGGCGLPSSNNVTVVPPVCTSPDGTQYTELSDPERDMFILKIGKKSDKPDKKSNLELELCTPKNTGETKTPIVQDTKDTQWNEIDAGNVLAKPSEASKVGKGAKGAKNGKGAKGKKKK